TACSRRLIPSAGSGTIHRQVIRSVAPASIAVRDRVGWAGQSEGLSANATGQLKTAKSLLELNRSGPPYLQESLMENRQQQPAAMSRLPSFLVRHAALIFGLKTFAAAMLAYSIAIWLETPRPYWAMGSVFITSTPLTGATSAKAVYRILGTLIGGAGTIVLLPNLVNSPELLSLGIALWLGIFLYFALIDGTPPSYGCLLAGYKMSLLGFPLVSTPELTFEIVVSRVQEIMLGIICASVVSMLVLPQSVASAITAQADSWLASPRRVGAVG